MFVRSRFAAVVAVVATLIAGPAQSAVRLTYPMGGAPTSLSWGGDAFPIAYEIDAQVASRYGRMAVERAFDVWARVPSANLAFRSATVVQDGRMGSNSRNSISVVDGLFRDQGFIAITTYWADNSGRMKEADIQIDPNYVGSVYPLQQTLQHEIGHLLGLDHSGILSSIMYPFVCKEDSLDLDTDDKIAIANLYPRVDPMLAGATLTGRVTHDHQGVFAAQVVAMNEHGEPVASVLTEQTGEFTLEAIPPGEYRVYAEPLDGPVTAHNFAGIYRDARSNRFPTRFAGPALRVDAGKVYGNLAIDVSGAPAELNPKWIGLAPAGVSQFSLYSNVVAVKPGAKAAIAVGGDGFTSGMTTFTVMNPDVKRIGDFRYASNYVYAEFEVAPDAKTTSAVVMVTRGNESAMLTGALRVDPSASGSKPRLIRK